MNRFSERAPLPPFSSFWRKPQLPSGKIYSPVIYLEEVERIFGEEVSRLMGPLIQWSGIERSDLQFTEKMKQELKEAKEKFRELTGIPADDFLAAADSPDVIIKEIGG